MKNTLITSMAFIAISTVSLADQNSEISAYSTAKAIIGNVANAGYPALSLSNNTLRFIPPEISTLTHLTELKIGHLENDISEVQGLEPISLEPIEGLTGLMIFEAFRPVKDIDTLSSFTELETLRLWPGLYDYCSNIGALPNIDNITIQLEENASLTCLSEMENLTRAHFRIKDCRQLDIASLVNSSATLISVICDSSPKKIVESLAAQWDVELETIFEVEHRPPSTFIELHRK